MTLAFSDAVKIAFREQVNARERDRTQGGFDRRSPNAPEPPTRHDSGRKLGRGDKSRMESGKTGERGLRRLGATPERRANIVYRLAQLNRSRQEIRGKIRVFGHTDSQPVGLYRAQRLRVPQPFDDIRSLAEVVLMRGKAASGFSVGEIEREIVGDQRQRTRAGRGDLGGTNCHLHLYKLWPIG